MPSIAPAVAAILALAPTTAAQLSVAPSPAQRPMTVQDIFTIQNIIEVVPSPDGSTIAVVVQRPAGRGETYGRALDGDDRADIWLLNRQGGPARNLTRGATDRSGYWQPRWSPDGRRLAMLSTRGGDNVRLYIWDAQTKAIKRLTEGGVDLGNGAAFGDDIAGTIRGPRRQAGAAAWLDATTLLVLELPPGEAPIGFDLNMHGPLRAARGWANLERDGVPTASVLETGGDGSKRPTLESQLRAIDVGKGTSRLIARLPYYRSTAIALNGTHTVRVSPDGRYAAVLVAVGSLPLVPEHRAWGKADTRLGIARLREGGIRWAADNGGLYSRLLEWSPDGAQIAVLAQAHRWTDEAADRLISITASTSEARQLLPDGWRARSAMPAGWNAKSEWSGSPRVGAVVWTAQGEPIVHADSQTAAGWWRHSRNEWTNVTAKLAGVPERLEWTGEPNVYVGIVEGDLWRLDVQADTATNLTAGFEPIVTDMIESDVPVTSGRRLGEMVVATAARRHSGYARVRLAGEPSVAPVPRPTANAALRGFRADLDLSLFTDVATTGTFLWRGNGRSRTFTRSLALNQHLGGIADVERRLIPYRGIDGDSLQALLLLPAEYDPHRRYPMVTWVYAGFVVHDSLVWPTIKNSSDPYNLIPLVSRGYAVLLPSMPLLSGPGEPFGDPYLDLPKGVIPAVDRVVELGIADPNRLGVMGASFGGYSTYALVTYTRRFRAAVALQGLSDLISWYGEFSEPFGESPHERLIPPGLAEQGQVGMGAAPWQNLWRYLRNTPLFFADRVQTPVLAIHGDRDQVVMGQSEEFFTALQRQGKRAKFIRYWGEAHAIEAPPNTAHMWNAIFDWFDTYLAAGGAEGASTSSGGTR